MTLKGKDILSIQDLSREEILYILQTAERMEELVHSHGFVELLNNILVAIIFLEPSTRTRLSFEAAAQRLSAKIITISDAKSSSSFKGETLLDTVKVVSGYADCIVLRQPLMGGAKMAAAQVDIPLINGGDGVGEHPTQALLDLYTIKKERRNLKDLKISLVGDLKYGRTVHSLSYALASFNPQFIFCSPASLSMPKAILKNLKNRGISYVKTTSLEQALKADIIYMTRIQKERFSEPAQYERLKNSYTLTKDFVLKSNKDILIMHPLPRVNEISTDVDCLPNAAYFRQAHNGMYIRMALLTLVLGKEKF